MSNFDNKRIKELSKHVADKIAAGEVVDRPLSIVKELVENAIDAGSTSIIVEIKNGGKSYIRITDNGCGINKEDVELAFQRHATSKINTESDLNSITSLGFRGEALASIAAVSRTELITKTKDEKSGVRVWIEGGERSEKADTGCPDGTTVIVRDLFYNTPARLKFMKPDATESALITDFISRISLAYSGIKFRFMNNGNILFSTVGKDDIYSSILTVYNRDIGEDLIHLKEKGDGLTLEAYVSRPSKSKTNRKNQIFFVNGRSISSKLMEHAVTEAYAEKMFEGRYPIVFLFLQVSPDRLDVNIHPNKKEVRFEDEEKVKSFLVSSIRNRLNHLDAAPEIKMEHIFKLNHTDQPVESTVSQISSPVIPDPKGTVKEQQVDIKTILSNERRVHEQTNLLMEQQQEDQVRESSERPAAAVTVNDQVRETGERYKPSETIKKSDFDLQNIQFTGSVFGTYITGVDDDCFYLLDQHAAHERVFYEKFLDEYEAEEKKQQTILVPIIMNVTHSIKIEAEDMLDFLGNMGFAIEEFGPKSYIVKAIPVFMEYREAEDFLEYIFDHISEGNDLKNQKKIDSIITNACKKAVKAHDLLDNREIDQLVLDLSKARNPYSCPHGRPTIVKLSKYEIEKNV